MSPKETLTVLEHPDVRELLRRITADNTLIALAVTQREASWTRFMGWLLDPARRGGRIPTLFLGALLAELQQRIPPGGDPALSSLRSADALRLQDIRVRCEEKYGPRTRPDLVVEFREGPITFHVIIENMMESTERDGQLQRYLEQAESRRRDGLLFRVPVLIDLKDDPEERASHPDAVVLYRADVSRWLSAGRDACLREWLTVPRLVDDYVALFAAQDLAKKIRGEHRDELEELHRSGELDPRWLSLDPWLLVDFEPFFAAVSQVQALRDACAEHRLQTEACGMILGRDATLKVTKPSWRIRPTDGSTGDHGIELRFQAHRRDQVEVHVEPWPYRGKLERAEEEREGRGALLDTKSELLATLREELTGRPYQRTLGASKSYLHDPTRVSTVGAVKFCPKKLGRECEPEEFAAVFAKIVETVTPVIDDHVGRLRGWSPMEAAEAG